MLTQSGLGVLVGVNCLGLSFSEPLLILTLRCESIGVEVELDLFFTPSFFSCAFLEA